MSSITISNLHPTGSDLFSDSESYLKELSESELDVQGGIWPILPAAMAMGGAFGVGFAAAAIYYSGTKCGL